MIFTIQSNDHKGTDFMKSLLTTVFSCIMVFQVAGAEPDRKTEFFARAVPSAEGFVNRLVKDGQTEPWPDLGVRSLMDNVYILAFADLWKADTDRQVPLEHTIPLLKLTEEMQDKDPESRTFGNLRWYWRTPEVTDLNAVEFIAAHALPVWLDARDRLPEESRVILERILQRAADGCINHKVSPDYTNIAIFNAVNLILLGEAFGRSDAIKLGNERLQAVLACFWDHGVYEFVSPTYYAPDIDTLQLGYKYVKDEQTKEIFRNLLDFFWTDLALNWYKPGLRMSGSQSRTYNYLLGVADSSRFLEFTGFVPWNVRATSVSYLNSFNADYAPSREILALVEKYPRRITQRWGAGPAQWRTTYVLDDIALGTSGAAYGRVKQNMVLTVDLADFAEVPKDKDNVTLLPRNYFISDGREDPYGTNRYPTSSAGHEKALHMDQLWIGAQRTVDAIGVAVYPAWTLDETVMTNVQSHFVFRKPDEIFLDGKKVVLEPNVALPTDNGPLVLRYGSRCIGIKVPWTRDRDGKSPIPCLIDDANKHGVCRFTVDHWPPNTPITRDSLGDDVPGIAMWVRVGSHLNSQEEVDVWSREFANAKVEKLDVRGNDISLHIAGVDGSLKIDGRKLSGQNAVVAIEPNGPNEQNEPSGILLLDGEDFGRPILEKIPLIAAFSKRIRDMKPVEVNAKGAAWEAEDGFCFLDYLTEDDDTASGGKAVRVNGEWVWSLDVREAGKYFLWTRVIALDPEHDSFLVHWTSQSGGKTSAGGDWHLGQGKTWRWIPLQLNNEKQIVPMELTPGFWRLTIRPREMDGRIDQFILTTDPGFKPPQ